MTKITPDFSTEYHTRKFVRKTKLPPEKKAFLYDQVLDRLIVTVRDRQPMIKNILEGSLADIVNGIVSKWIHLIVLMLILVFVCNTVCAVMIIRCVS